jgi:hypothetical protein
LAGICCKQGDVQHALRQGLFTGISVGIKCLVHLENRKYFVNITNFYSLLLDSFLPILILVLLFTFFGDKIAFLEREQANSAQIL